MSDPDEARVAIDNAITALAARRRATQDADARAELDDAIEDLQAQRAALNEQDLNACAEVVAAAAETLAGCVRQARADPFDAPLTTALAALKAS